MKQRISIDQLKQLTSEQQNKLRAWWTCKEGDWFKPINSDQEQLLSDRSKECTSEQCEFDDWYGWCVYLEENCLPLLSIGQCIELLNENHDYFYMCSDGEMHIGSIYNYYKDGPDRKGENLIDVLWEAVKPILLLPLNKFKLYR